MTQVLGIVDIVWQGRNIPVEKGAKLKLGGIMNKPVVYGRKVGRAQEFAGSEIEATTVLERGQKFKELYSVGEGELQVQCDTGQVFTWPDAFLTDQREMTGGEGGKVPLKWSGGEPEEIVA
ncbi:MAG: hypothetical protein C0458_15990 [Methylobacterium sp.]|nr:hypothetical protein [Methylobacterium sp.]